MQRQSVMHRFVPRETPDKRRRWSNYPSEPPEITDKDRRNLASFESIGCAYFSVIKLDDPVSANSKSTRLDFMRGADNPESNAIMFETSKALLLFLSRLEKIDPKTAEVLKMRMKGVTLKEIGIKFGFCRERSRQIEQGAITHILLDNVLRQAIADISPNFYEEMRETGLVIDHLKAMGITEDAIVKWGETTGFSGYLSTRLAMIALSEVYYPFCFTTAKTHYLQSDRVDSKRFSLFFRYALLKHLKLLCDSFEIVQARSFTQRDADKFMQDVRKLAVDYTPKDLQRFFRKEESINFKSVC